VRLHHAVLVAKAEVGHAVVAQDAADLAQDLVGVHHVLVDVVEDHDVDGLVLERQPGPVRAQIRRVLAEQELACTNPGTSMSRPMTLMPVSRKVSTMYPVEQPMSMAVSPLRSSRPRKCLRTDAILAALTRRLCSSCILY